MKLSQDIVLWNEAFTRHSGLHTLVCTHGSYKAVAEEAKLIVGQTAHQISLLKFVAAENIAGSGKCQCRINCSEREIDFVCLFDCFV